MLELWGMLSTPSLPSISGPLWPGVVARDSVLSICQIELNYVLILNRIVWNRTVFDIETIPSVNWIVCNRTVYVYKKRFGWCTIKPNKTFSNNSTIYLNQPWHYWIDRFKRTIKPSKHILYQDVRIWRSLYVHFYIFLCICFLRVFFWGGGCTQSDQMRITFKQIYLKTTLIGTTTPHQTVSENNDREGYSTLLRSATLDP